MVTVSPPAPPSVDLSRIRLRPTQAHEVGLVADLLVDGSTAHPVWGMIDLHGQHADAERFIFECQATLMAEAGTSFLICIDAQVIGHVCIAPPGATIAPSTWSMLKLAWSLPFRFGWTFTHKLLDLLDTVDKQMDPVLNRLQPATMLERFVVRSEWRGHGIGRYVLRELVLKHRERVVLTTETTRNVAFYERVGFRVVKELTLRTWYGRDCESWAMACDADTQTQPVV